MNLDETKSLFGVLADSTRLRLLFALSIETLAVSELVAAFDISQPRVSHHLALLLKAGLVTVLREGPRAFYSLEPSEESKRLVSEVLSMIDEDPVLVRDNVRILQQIGRRKAASQAFFSDLAGRWPGKIGKWIDLPRYKSLLIDLLPSGLTTADLGCGPGWLLPEMASRAPMIIGVDHSPEFLAMARQHAAESGLANCEFRLGELEHLPLGDSEIQLVVMGLVLHYLVDPRAALCEAARVSKDNAQLLVVEPLRHTIAQASLELGEIWMGFSKAELTAWIKEAGFKPSVIEAVPPQPGKLGLLAIRAAKKTLSQSEP